MKPLKINKTIRFSILSGISSAFFFTLTPIAIQKTSHTITNEELLFYRGLFCVVFTTPFVLRQIPLILKKEALVIWLRSLAGAAALLCYFWTTRTGSAAAAKALNNLAPVFVLVISILLKTEKLHLRELFGILISGLGIICLSVNQYNNQFGYKWVAVGLISAVFASIAFLSVKKATGKYSAFLIVWCFSIVLMLIGVFSKIPTPLSYGREDLFWVFIAAITSLFGQITLTWSYIALKASVAATLSLLTLILLMLFDLIITQNIANFIQFYPYIFIIIGIFLTVNGHRKKSKKLTQLN